MIMSRLKYAVCELERSLTTDKYETVDHPEFIFSIINGDYINFENLNFSLMEIRWVLYDMETLGMKFPKDKIIARMEKEKESLSSSAKFTLVWILNEYSRISI